eukprot:2127669-Pyramimonas_sp.AAC.1
MQQVENCYIKAYAIPDQGASRFQGRADHFKLKDKEVRERGPRRPRLMYGVNAQGEAPAAIRRARQRYAAALAAPWPGICTTTFPKLEGKDPALQLPRAQLRAWFDLHAHRADLRELISKVWCIESMSVSRDPRHTTDGGNEEELSVL